MLPILEIRLLVVAIIYAVGEKNFFEYNPFVAKLNCLLGVSKRYQPFFIKIGPFWEDILNFCFLLTLLS